MLKTGIFLLILAIAAIGFGQDDSKYRQRATEIRAEIRSNNSKEFQRTEIPADMKNESAVIIAASFEMLHSAKDKMKLRIPVQTILLQTTQRKRVKINDNAALEKFSVIEYIKKEDLTYSVFFTKFNDKTGTYIGAKIIKANGVETELNTDEEVLTENKKKYQEGKFAIAGLQTGDILDYYIRTEAIFDGINGTFGPYTFYMAQEYPVLNYSVKYILSNKVAVDYISANGAPGFTQSTNNNGDIILQLAQSNLPKYNSELWTSSYRQYPYVRLQFSFESMYQRSGTHIQKGKVRQGLVVNDIVENYKKVIQGRFRNQDFAVLPMVEKYFGGAEKMKEISKDSVLKVLYNAWRYKYISSHAAKNADEWNDIKYSYANSLSNAANFSKMLTSLDIDNTVYLVC